MEVNVSSNNNGILEVSYCNHGNTSAQGAYVEIEITNDLLITQSTIPVSSLVNKKYTFNLGNVNSLDCGTFYIEIPNLDKRIHCTSVQIFPTDPCQAMIDRYIINHTGDTGNTGDNGGDGDDDNNVNTAVTFSAEMYYSAPGTPILGQGGTNSVFEDHVFLDNIPTWDSLLFVLTNSGVLPNIGNTNTTNTASTIDDLNDITTLTSAELCLRSNGTSVVLTNVISQTASIATDDKTILGGGAGNGNQASSNGSVINDRTILGGELDGNSAGLIDVENESYKYADKKVVINLYPNPFTNSATITINGGSYKKIRLEVLDLSGKTIQSLQFNEEQEITLRRNNLNQGVYLYRLIGDNVSVHTGKFIIL
jgi:hypothetical protein